MIAVSPLLEAAALRVEVGERVLTDGLSLKLDGPRVVLVGDTMALLGPFFGWAGIVRGWLKIQGEELSVALPRLGLAPLDAPMPDDFSPSEYVAWSAVLAGLSENEATTRARELLTRGGLGAVLDKRLGDLGVVPRRITMLAHALVAGPRLLIAEGPLDGLDAESGFYVLNALGGMIGKTAAIVTTKPFEPGSPADSLARGADEVALIENGEVLEQGRPADLVPPSDAPPSAPPPLSTPPPSAPPPSGETAASDVASPPRSAAPDDGASS
jgi:ABC-type cobalamin/Fe3+-siderophores transport system ATPase subunit